MVERGHKTITRVFFWKEVKNLYICNPTVCSTLSLQPSDLKFFPLLSREIYSSLASDRLHWAMHGQATAGFCPQWTKITGTKHSMKECQESLMAWVTRSVCRLSICHLCTLHSVLTISTCTLQSETSDLLKTAKQRSPKYWRIKKMNPSNCLHSLKREMWNKVFFSLIKICSHKSTVFSVKNYILFRNLESKLYIVF